MSDSFIHACAGGAGGVLAMTTTYPLMSISTRAAVLSSEHPEEVSKSGGTSGEILIALTTISLYQSPSFLLQGRLFKMKVSRDYMLGLSHLSSVLVYRICKYTS
jgi:hypothetical protein